MTAPEPEPAIEPLDNKPPEVATERLSRLPWSERRPAVPYGHASTEPERLTPIARLRPSDGVPTNTPFGRRQR